MRLRSMSSPWLRIAGLGALGGVRATAPLSLLSGQLADGRELRGLARLATAGELIVDKLPRVPSRLAPAGLLPRLLVGALAGRWLALRAGRPAWAAVLLGAGAAYLGARAGHALRMAAIQRAHLPNALAGAAEDALVLGLGQRLVRGV